MAEKLQFGYWNIRGLGNPVRILLGHLGVEYEETLYDVNNRDSWLSVKETLGLPLPNIPHIIQGDLKMSENAALLQYLCLTNRPEYLGRDVEEQRQLFEISSYLAEFCGKLMGGCFNYKEETKEEFLETLRGYLRRVDGYMGDRPYLVSTAGPTWIDFRFLEFVSLMKNVDGDFLTREFPKFNEYRNRMLALDGVQAAYDRYKGMTYVPSFAGLCPLDS